MLLYPSSPWISVEAVEICPRLLDILFCFMNLFSLYIHYVVILYSHLFKKTMYVFWLTMLTINCHSFIYLLETLT